MIASIETQTIPMFTYAVALQGGTFRFLDVDLRGGHARWAVTGLSREALESIPGVVGVE